MVDRNLWLNTFAIIGNSDDVLFAPDERHLIRVGTDKAVPMVHVPSDALIVSDPEHRRQSFRQSLQVRRSQFGTTRFLTGSLETRSCGTRISEDGYHQAAKACGWKPLGSGDLAPVKLRIRESDAKTGRAMAWVEGNPGLALERNSADVGGVCQMILWEGLNSLFGIKQGQWGRREGSWA